jgi:hypothetical protein
VNTADAENMRLITMSSQEQYIPWKGASRLLIKQAQYII